MAFLFKSKKNQDRALASREGNNGSQGSNGSIQSAGARVPRDEKNTSGHRATPTGSVNSIDNDGSVGSPDQALGHGRRGGSLDQTQQSDLPFRNGPPVSNNNAALYPWSQRRFTYTSSHPSPFPRYGAAVNSVSSKEGDIYMMGGLINSSTVKGDLWMIEAGGNMACYPLPTTAEGPGPRVGHSSLLVGNAFIVYGGDTKIDENDALDETLYLLNTSTRQWSRALPAGPRPAGRYGHSLNILGSKIFVFGGQVEGYFMNDLSAFDLNQLQMPNNRWEILIHGETSPKIPAARTNHSIVTFQDKMYLFGGTNGFQWFNDVWCYDSTLNNWSQLDCIGYIPAPREGHAAALVDDVMYVFGGRTEEGTDLGDLAAFKLSSRRWYTFQNMGPSPSSRSGHSMTTVGKSIVVLGGEPSSAASAINDLGILYVLDTSKIRYPSDAQQAGQKAALPQGRRPSTEGVGSVVTGRQIQPRETSNGPHERRMVSPSQNFSTAPNGYRPPTNGPDVNGGAMNPNSGPPGSRLPRASMAQGPAGPPPQGPTPAKPTIDTSAMGRTRGPSVDRAGPSSSPQIGSNQSPVTREVVSNQSPITREVIAENGIPMTNGRRTPTQNNMVAPTMAAPTTAAPTMAAPTMAAPTMAAPTMAAPTMNALPVAQEPLVNGDGIKSKQGRQGRSQGSVDSSIEPGLRAVANRPSSPPPPSRQTSNPLNRRSSGRNSQTVALLKELDSARNRNAWYASELELARKSGYVSNATMGPALDAKGAETFDDEDRPLIEALLAMRTELANVQSAVDKQAITAARQIGESDKQRDAAIQEAVYAKAKLAAHLNNGALSEGDRGHSDARSSDMSKKLASALHLQKDLQARIDSAKAELESERKARQLADDTTNAAQRRMADLESYKQRTSTEVEHLKSELHLAQREAREQSVTRVEAVAALELLKVEKEDFATKYNDAVGTSKDHSETFGSLRATMASAEDAKAHLEAKLEEERTLREKVESKFNKLKVEHEARTAELVAVSQRLRDAEELAERHANEAKTHRQAVLSGLDKLSARDTPKASSADAERVIALQNQAASATALVKKYQQEVDTAADKLRSAEERIAGLEQYQEQSSREGVTIRRQLQSALREAQSLQAAHSDVRNHLAAQQLETNAMTVQHNALKDILSERGISPTGAVRARNLGSPRDNSPELMRVRELEAQLAGATASHEETKQAFAFQTHESETAYREKLSQLESDYQSAVHYVKGTEKMLKQLQEQLSRYKTENSRLKSEVVDLEDRLEEDGHKSAAPGDWEMERTTLQNKVNSLEHELHTSGAQLEKSLAALRTELNDSKRQRDDAIRGQDDASKMLTSHRNDLEQLQSENALLEQRAHDAEQKVALLLDQVEHSVDNYRRQSRQVMGLNPEPVVVANGAGIGHVRNESSDTESAYGGNGLDNRNSAALDNLASELETLRTHWEATNKNYRLSTNFDFDPPAMAKKGDENAAGPGLSESLADWRKKLDTDEPNADKTRHG